MTKLDKNLLISQAAKLTTLGMTLERERNNLKKLVEQGVSYDSPKMMQAYERFKQVDDEWKQLEAEHLRLRRKVGKT